VDGARAETFKINLNQVGVMLDKGSHTVEFEYRPTLYIWLLRLQLVVLFVLALYILYRAYIFISRRRLKE
jgi:uncharacterized membrane protein YfhO